MSALMVISNLICMFPFYNTIAKEVIDSSKLWKKRRLGGRTSSCSIISVALNGI